MNINNAKQKGFRTAQKLLVSFINSKATPIINGTYIIGMSTVSEKKIRYNVKIQTNIKISLKILLVSIVSIFIDIQFKT